MYPVSGGFGLAAGGMGMGGESGDFGGSYLMASQSQWLTQYLRRVWSWEQMDFEQCFDQMVTLLGPEPFANGRRMIWLRHSAHPV